MNTIKLLLVSELDETGWKDYFNLSCKINNKFYGSDLNLSSLLEFKSARLKERQKYNSREYLLIKDNEPCAWFAIKRDTRSSMFIFDSVNDEPSENEISAVFKSVYDYILELGQDASFHWSYNERLNRALLKAGAVINEELIITRLERKEMNPEFYTSIVNSADLNGYLLKFYNAFPENVADNFTSMMNEVFSGMNKLNPFGVKIADRTAGDWIRKYNYESGDGSQMKMFMLFDEGGKIAAYCSLFIDNDNPLKVRHEGGFTVVAPAHRGKGLARFLKAKMYLMLLAENQSFTYITTDTMPWNKYMYRINEEFGFKPFEHGADLKVTKEFLKDYLNLK